MNEHQDDHAHVSREMSGRLLQHGTVAARIRLNFHRNDPYAVVASVRLPGVEPVVWVFARDLLTTGLTERAGLGDVVISPCPTGPEVLVHLTLRSPMAKATLEIRVSAIAEFLRETQRIVAIGTEWQFQPVDDDIRAIAG